MTENLWEKPCLRYIKACVRYYMNGDRDPIMTDQQYDILAHELYENWEKLPIWFVSFMKKEDFLGSGYVWGWNFGIGEWSIGTE